LTLKDLQDLAGSLDKKFDAQDKKFDEKFEAQDKKFDKKFDALGNKFALFRGEMHERALRSEVAKQFGEPFSKQLTIKGCFDLHQILPETPMYSDLVGRNALSATLCTQVQKQKLVTLYAARLYQELMNDEKFQGLANFVDESESLSKINIGSAIKRAASMKDVNVQSRLERLNAADDVLMTCKGAGIMAIVAATNPDLKLREVPQELQFDARGNIQIIGDVATIDTAEMKSSNDIGGARDQLKVRLNFLEWVVNQAFPVVARVRKIGRVIVPLSVPELEPKDQANLGSGFSFYVHRM